MDATGYPGRRATRRVAGFEAAVDLSAARPGLGRAGLDSDWTCARSRFHPQGAATNGGMVAALLCGEQEDRFLTTGCPRAIPHPTQAHRQTSSPAGIRSVELIKEVHQEGHSVAQRRPYGPPKARCGHPARGGPGHSVPLVRPWGGLRLPWWASWPLLSINLHGSGHASTTKCCLMTLRTGPGYFAVDPFPTPCGLRL
jgi:hypothetical protein